MGHEPYDDQRISDLRQPRRTPSAATIMRNTADWVESHPIDYESLAGGPLGEALTRAEIEEMADDPQAIAEFVTGVRDMADRAASQERRRSR